MTMFAKLFLLCFIAVFVEAAKEKLSEELLIKQAPSGHVTTFFKFTTRWEEDIREAAHWTHFNLLPRSLGEIIAQYRVQELSLTLTQGLWRYEKWGYPVRGAPPGAAVLARFRPDSGDSVESVDELWAGLTNALAGLFCSSLNTLDKTQGISPTYSFSPGGVTGPGLSSNSSYLRYGVLPKEYPCTENLTPWKKLLPCKSSRGLGAVLHNSAHSQQFSTFQSLSLDIRPVCRDPECVQLATEVSQSATIVFDPAIFNKQHGDASWSVKQLFGIGLPPVCPLAASSMVYIDITDDKFVLDPPPQRDLVVGSGGHPRKVAVYDLLTFTDSGIKNVNALHHKSHIYGIIPGPPLVAARHVTGTGQERGGIVTTIRNSGGSPVTVVYLDLIPWFLRIYLHTLRLECNGKSVKPDLVHYTPGRDRERPYHLEVVLTIPARSEMRVEFDLEYSVLRWTEYPPDANHGFYIGSAVVTARLPRAHLNNATILAREDSSLSYLFWGNPDVDPVVNIYTEILLVTLPTPDFSMPYNVICLACTVAALAFGPLHNITTKSLSLVPPEEEERSLLGKLLSPFTSKFRMIKEKFVKKPANTSPTAATASDTTAGNSNCTAAAAT